MNEAWLTVSVCECIYVSCKKAESQRSLGCMNELNEANTLRRIRAPQGIEAIIGPIKRRSACSGARPRVKNGD